MNINIPFSELRKDISHLIGEQMRALMGFFNKMFVLARLVKPTVCVQFLSRGRTSGDKLLAFAVPVYSYGVVSDVIVATKSE